MAEIAGWEEVVRQKKENEERLVVIGHLPDVVQALSARVEELERIVARLDGVLFGPASQIAASVRLSASQIPSASSSGTGAYALGAALAQPGTCKLNEVSGNRAADTPTAADIADMWYGCKGWPEAREEEFNRKLREVGLLPPQEKE